MICDNKDWLELRRSGGDSIFEFLYVEDAVNGLLAAGQHLRGGTPTYHFSGGSNTRLSILALTKEMSLAFDGRERDIHLNRSNPERKVEKYLRTDATTQELAWKPAWTLSEGLKHTLQWYRQSISHIQSYDEEMGLNN